MLSIEDIGAVSPALAKYAQQGLLGEVWKRADLSPRDRSIVTVSTLIARHQTVQLQSQLEMALDNGVQPSELPAATDKLLPIDRKAEAQRAQSVQENFGAVAAGVVQYTDQLLFNELWLRPALAPRDRSLVTVSALIANGQAAQLPYHLNRAMDNGLTQAEASELLTQMAFYAGWPNVFSALPVFKDVFAKRPH